MAEKKVVQVGKKLKDFKLKDQNGQDFLLSDCKGKRVLLSFHPLAWTSVCAQQMQSLEKNKKALDKLNTVAVGLSIDSRSLQGGLGQKPENQEHEAPLRFLAPRGGGQIPGDSAGRRVFGTGQHHRR